ncbi:hypothetical protein Q8F55_008081 [Vanrija albida]|uniref:PCI domain-containing protein n=1 Tax=Vanrija albida TaxID=181172 RepID=A0ABR3PVJ9_9TREE
MTRTRTLSPLTPPPPPHPDPAQMTAWGFPPDPSAPDPGGRFDIGTRVGVELDVDSDPYYPWPPSDAADTAEEAHDVSHELDPVSSPYPWPPSDEDVLIEVDKADDEMSAATGSGEEEEGASFEDDDDFARLSDDNILSEYNIAELEASDQRMTRAQLAEVSSLAGAVDTWCVEYTKKQFSFCTEEQWRLAFAVLPRIKRNMAEESRGLFRVSEAGLLQKSRKFGSSLRDVFLQETVQAPDGETRQLLDLAYAVILRTGGSALRADHETFRQDPTLAALQFDAVLARGAPARHTRATGLYLRSLHVGQDLLLYVGSLVDLAIRQREHDRAGVNRHARRACEENNLTGKDWSAVVVCHFGNRQLAAMPPPFLLAVESCVIGAARLLSRPVPAQVNLVDAICRMVPHSWLRSWAPASAPAVDDLLEAWRLLHAAAADIQERKQAGRFAGIGLHLPLVATAEAQVITSRLLLIIAPLLAPGDDPRRRAAVLVRHLFKTGVRVVDGKVGISESACVELAQLKQELPIEPSAFCPAVEDVYSWPSWFGEVGIDPAAILSEAEVSLADPFRELPLAEDVFDKLRALALSDPA